MRRLLLASITLALLAQARPAAADLATIYGEIHAGALTGGGLGGAQKDQDFFKKSGNLTFGGLVGAEVAFIDFWIGHDEFYDGKVQGTWTEFMAGIDTQIPFDAFRLELGAGLGFGLGTGQQIDLPLDNAQISDKGFLFEGKVGFVFPLSKVMSFDIRMPVGLAYMLKNDVANDLSNHYTSLHVSALACLQLHFGL